MGCCWPADRAIGYCTTGSKRLPVPSVRRWGGDRSTQLEFSPQERGWQTMDGTVPAGSSWRKFPLPTVLWQREGPSFAPVCNESQACKDYARGGGFGPRTGVCKCSGHSNGGPLLPNIEMVDLLQIPADTPPGKYVLQWRWDCTATSTSFWVHFPVASLLLFSTSPYLAAAYHPDLRRICSSWVLRNFGC